MIIFKKAAALSEYLKKQQVRGRSVGFVPTMGALHKGHLSLMEESRAANEITVCSIFVNPTQFNNPEDFAKYPKTMEQDIAALYRAGVTILFHPPVEEIYPSQHIKKKYDLGTLEQRLEGRFRPGHFQGVCEVMERLLTIIPANRLYMGQKDYQQCMVIRRLVGLLGLPVALHFLPTLREADGLAMSSRNLRLSEEERRRALVLFRTLSRIREHYGKKPAQQLEQEAVLQIEQEGLTVDYVSIADAATLDPVQDPKQKAIVLVAATIGKVRLIDNLLLN